MLIANFVSCNSLWGKVHFFLYFLDWKDLLQCVIGNSIVSNFAISVCLRDLISFAIYSPFVCKSSLLEIDKGMNRKIVQFFFCCWLKPNNDIFITNKNLCLVIGSLGWIDYLLLCSETMRTTISKIKILIW